LISGGVAGGAEGFITNPFEFAKPRVQLAVSPVPCHLLPSLISTKTPIPDRASYLQSEDPRALYKGCGALVTESMSKDAVRFLYFDTVKNAFKDRESGALRPWRNMLAGMTAGVVASVSVTPMERIKTALSDDAGQGKRYTFNIHCIRTIIQEDGFKGLYLDLVGTLKQASATSFRVGIYNIIKHFEENKGVQAECSRVRGLVFLSRWRALLRWC
jgi:solute carrier family 25 citrate transporter 1